eukprot:1158439-Pelagomonas_calceolata.AAC.6
MCPTGACHVFYWRYIMSSCTGTLPCLLLVLYHVFYRRFTTSSTGTYHDVPVVTASLMPPPIDGPCGFFSSYAGMTLAGLAADCKPHATLYRWTVRLL